MRVLFVIAHLDKGGGQAVQCRQLFERMRSRLASAELLALSARSPPTFGPQPDGSTVIAPLRFPGGLLDLRREIRERAREFDLVHALDIYYALPAARLAGVAPLVVRLGSHPVEDLASRWGWWGRTWMEATRPWLFHGVTTVVNSAHLLPTVPAGDVRWIPNGVDVPRFASAPERGDARARLGLPEGVPIVVFTGKVLPRKNVEDILWLLSRRPDLHFLLVGALSEPYYGDRYWRIIASRYAPVISRVHAVGEVPIEMLPQYLAAGDVFVFPSRLEGMPNSILEAMAAGLPVVASENPSHTDIVRRGGGRTYRTREEMLDAVDHFLADPAGRERTGRASRRYVAETFGFEASVQAYLRLYHDLVG
ncbi:MAG: glycosyltransferase family 4 protein [Thermoplasmata archaeon]